MTRAYDESYLEGAMVLMGDMMEYAVLDLGYDADAFFKMFLESSFSREFEIGRCSVVAGRSGVELARDVFEEIECRTPDVEPSWREDRSSVFWAGWAFAFFQWSTGHPFERIWHSISFRQMLRLYGPLHEADITRTVDVMLTRMTRPEKKRISALRRLRGLTQKGLAREARMTVAQVQRLEYGERTVAKLSLSTALNLADALGVDVRQLVEG